MSCGTYVAGERGAALLECRLLLAQQAAHNPVPKLRDRPGQDVDRQLDRRDGGEQKHLGPDVLLHADREPLQQRGEHAVEEERRIPARHLIHTDLREFQLCRPLRARQPFGADEVQHQQPRLAVRVFGMLRPAAQPRRLPDPHELMAFVTCEVSRQRLQHPLVLVLPREHRLEEVRRREPDRNFHLVVVRIV